jgi:hypothetical protein
MGCGATDRAPPERPEDGSDRPEVARSPSVSHDAIVVIAMREFAGRRINP